MSLGCRWIHLAPRDRWWGRDPQDSGGSRQQSWKERGFWRSKFHSLMYFYHSTVGSRWLHAKNIFWLYIHTCVTELLLNGFQTHIKQYCWMAEKKSSDEKILWKRYFIVLQILYRHTQSLANTCTFFRSMLIISLFEIIKHAQRLTVLNHILMFFKYISYLALW